MGLPFKIKKALFPRTRVINRTINQSGGTGGDLELGETSADAYRGDRGKTAYDYSQVGHVPLTSKDATGGYAGLTLFKINFKNALNTITSFFTNANTVARTYTFQNRDGTIADDTDLALKAPIASPSFTGAVNSAGGVSINAPASGSPNLAIKNNTSTAQGLIGFQRSDGTNKSGIGTYRNFADEGNLELMNGSDTFVYMKSTGELVATKLLDLSGAAAGQIKFPATQNASSDPNTLDDYEEGTFTPVISFGGGTTGITYASHVGFYTKIGRQVHSHGYIDLDSKGSSTGATLITGFAFASANTVGSYSVASMWFENFNSVGVPQNYMLHNKTEIALFQLSALGASTTISNTVFTDDTHLMFSLTYNV